VASKSKSQQRPASPVSQLQVDPEKLLDIFSPYKDRRTLSTWAKMQAQQTGLGNAAYADSFNAFDASLQQHHSGHTVNSSVQADGASSGSHPFTTSTSAQQSPRTPRTPKQSHSGVGMPQADKDLLTKFASKLNTRHLHGHTQAENPSTPTGIKAPFTAQGLPAGGSGSGTGGNFSYVGRGDNVVIPALGIGVDTALRGNLVLVGPGGRQTQTSNQELSPANSVESSSGKPQLRKKLGSATSRASISISDVNMSQNLTPFTQATSGSPTQKKLPQGVASSTISPLHQLVASGIDPTTGQPLSPTLYSGSSPSSGRRASMPGLRRLGPTQQPGTAAIMDVKKILSGISTKQSASQSQTRTLAHIHGGQRHGDGQQVDEDEDLLKQVEDLRHEMMERHHQQHSSLTAKSKGAVTSKAPAPASGSVSPTSRSHAVLATPTSHKSSSKKSRNLSGTSDNSDATNNSNGLDMATVRDLTTMIQSIKKETITNMTGAWKR
jgi:hypothetical protein